MEIKNEEIKKIYELIQQQIKNSEKIENYCKKEEEIWKYVMLGLACGSSLIEISNGFYPSVVFGVLKSVFSVAVMPTAAAVMVARSPTQKKENLKKYISAKKIVLNEIIAEYLKPEEKRESNEDFFKKIKNMCSVADELDV